MSLPGPMLTSQVRAADAPPAAAKPALRPLGELLVAGLTQRMRDPQFDLATVDEELRGLEKFLVGREAERTREVAQVRFMHVTLVVQVQRDYERGMPLLEQLAADFAGTDLGNEIMPHLRRLFGEAMEMKRIAGLIGQPAPAITFAWSSDDTLRSLADVRGKVVVLDFWTTSAGLRGRSYGEALPALRELVGRYAGYNVAFIAVTSLQEGIHGLDDYIIPCEGDPAREYELMRQFMTKYDVRWPVVFSADGVFDSRYGVRAIPHTVILAPDGTIRRSESFGALPPASRAGVIDELLREAGLKVPAGTP